MVCLRCQSPRSPARQRGRSWILEVRGHPAKGQPPALWPGCLQNAFIPICYWNILRRRLAYTDTHENTERCISDANICRYILTRHACINIQELTHRHSFSRTQTLTCIQNTFKHLATLRHLKWPSIPTIALCINSTPRPLCSSSAGFLSVAVPLPEGGKFPTMPPLHMLTLTSCFCQLSPPKWCKGWFVEYGLVRYSTTVLGRRCVTKNIWTSLSTDGKVWQNDQWGLKPASSHSCMFSYMTFHLTNVAYILLISPSSRQCYLCAPMFCKHFVMCVFV